MRQFDGKQTPRDAAPENRYESMTDRPIEAAAAGHYACLKKI
jgi:hypothetical protein